VKQSRRARPTAIAEHLVTFGLLNACCCSVHNHASVRVAMHYFYYYYFYFHLPDNVWTLPVLYPHAQPSVLAKHLLRFTFIFFQNTLRYWLDFGIDGFRVINTAYLFENSDLQNETASSSCSSVYLLELLCFASGLSQSFSKPLKYSLGMEEVWRSNVEVFQIERTN